MGREELAAFLAGMRLGDRLTLTPPADRLHDQGLLYEVLLANKYGFICGPTENDPHGELLPPEHALELILTAPREAITFVPATAPYPDARALPEGFCRGPASGIGTARANNLTHETRPPAAPVRETP